MPWSLEEENILREFYPKEGPKGLLVRLPHRSKIAINLRAFTLGVVFDNDSRFSPEEEAFIRDNYFIEGPTKIAKTMGRSFWAISNKAQRMQLLTKTKRGSEHAHYQGHGDIHGAFWTRIQRSAKERRRPFEITIQYAWELYEKQDRRCKLSCLPIKFPSYSQASDGTASLDRIDSTKGYVEGNVQWVHKDINMMKQDHSDVDFIALCRAVAQCNNGLRKNL